MPLRPPAFGRRAAPWPGARDSIPARTEERPGAYGPARIVRPIPSRTAPLRQPELFPPPPAREPFAPSAATVEAVDSAYRVYERYVEEGRQYAAGQSAWLHGGNRPDGRADGARSPAQALPGDWATVGRLLEALGAAARPAGATAPWVGLITKALPILAAELGRSAAPRSDEYGPTAGESWRPWFRQDDVPPNEVPAAVNHARAATAPPPLAARPVSHEFGTQARPAPREDPAQTDDHGSGGARPPPAGARHAASTIERGDLRERRSRHSSSKKAAR